MEDHGVREGEILPLLLTYSKDLDDPPRSLYLSLVPSPDRGRPRTHFGLSVNPSTEPLEPWTTFRLLCLLHYNRLTHKKDVFRDKSWETIEWSRNIFGDSIRDSRVNVCFFYFVSLQSQYRTSSTSTLGSDHHFEISEVGMVLRPPFTTSPFLATPVSLP